MTMITDSRSLIESIKSTKQVTEKLVRPLIKWAKEMIDSNNIQEVRWCGTRVCLADALTKPGSNTTEDLFEVCESGRMIDLKETDKEKLRDDIGGIQ